jgi:hypothetical protein
VEGAVNSRLQLGLKEAEGPDSYRYPSDILSHSGPYGHAIKRFRSKGFGIDDAHIDRLVFRLVHECEQAREWSFRGQDYPSALDERYELRREISKQAHTLVEQLAKLAKREPFFFRHSLKGALEKQVEDHADLDVLMPDANHPDGGFRHTAPARTWLYTDHLLCWRIGLFQCDEFLHDWASELDDASRQPRLIRRLGCLRFEPGLSRRAASKVRIEIAGLSAWLSYHLRNATAGRPVVATGPGLVMPKDGKPCWELVADFANAAFPANDPVSATSLRQQWATLSGPKVVKLDPWPREAIREPQVSS